MNKKQIEIRIDYTKRQIESIREDLAIKGIAACGHDTKNEGSSSFNSEYLLGLYCGQLIVLEEFLCEIEGGDEYMKESIRQDDELASTMYL